MSDRPPDEPSPMNRRRAFNAERRRQLRQMGAIQADTAAEVVRLLRAAEVQIRLTLAGQPTDFQLWRLPQLQAQVRRAITDIEFGLTTALGQGLDRSWSAGIALVDLPLVAAGVDVRASLTRLDTRMLMAMRELATDRVRDISTTAVNRINGEIANVIIGVRTPGDAIATVTSAIDGGAQRAGTIIRTELGTAYAAAAQGRMAQTQRLVPGLRKQWRRSIKRHPRLSHDAIDGQVVPVDQPFVLAAGITLMYPRDPAATPSERVNCGCMALPYVKSWDMLTPGRRPYSPEELATSPVARLLRDVADPPTAAF